MELHDNCILDKEVDFLMISYLYKQLQAIRAIHVWWGLKTHQIGLDYWSIMQRATALLKMGSYGNTTMYQYWDNRLIY